MRRGRKRKEKSNHVCNLDTGPIFADRSRTLISPRVKNEARVTWAGVGPLVLVGVVGIRRFLEADS